MRLIFFLLFCIFQYQQLSIQKKPILIIPGLGGSRIQAKLQNKTSDHIFCQKNSDWHYIWLNLVEMVYPYLYCWKEEIKLIYDVQTDTFKNNDGVETRVLDTHPYNTIDILDSRLPFAGSVYFKPLTDFLKLQLDYTEGYDLQIAPYDFRLGPKSLNFTNYLKNKIENQYYQNQNQKVVLISHSMGAKHTLLMLNQVSQEWKDTFIDSWISYSPAYGGSPRIFKFLASGDNNGIFFVKALDLRDTLRQWESLFWLLPDLSIYPKDEILVKTPIKSYSAHDFRSLLIDMDYQYVDQILKRYEDYNNITDPGVIHFPFYGSGQPTPRFLDYSKNDKSFFEFGMYKGNQYFNSEPIIETEDGDGSVPTRSLEMGNNWQKTILTDQHKANGYSHNSILENQDIHIIIYRILTNIQ